MTANASKTVYRVLERKNKLYARESSINMETRNLRWVFKRRYKNKPGKSKMNAQYDSERSAFCYSSTTHKQTRQFILTPGNINNFSNKRLSLAKLRHVLRTKKEQK